MSESEKLTAAIAEYERETTKLTADVEGLTQRLVTATTTAEQAIAVAERRADDATQAAAVDAEQARQRLAAALSRKRLALVAATADLQAARQALATSKRAAQFVQLQSALDELVVAAGAIDVNPTDPTGWASLRGLIDGAQMLYAVAGGRGRLVEDPSAIRGKLWGALGVQVDWALGLRRESLAPVPAMADLLGLRSAAGRVREMMDNA